MKILLTGSNGFLGKHVRTELLNRNIGFDTINRSRAAKSTFQLDLAEEIPHFQSQYSHVIHIAGKAHSYPKSEKEKNDFYKVNVQGTKNLINALTWIPKAVIYISSVAVYGIQEGKNINEDAALDPTTDYGKSKLSAEAYLSDWANANGCRLVILRLPLIVGDEPVGNLKRMVKAVKRGRYLPLYKSRAQKSMVLAEDVAKLIAQLLHKGKGTYNLTDGLHPKISEIEKVLFKRSGKRPILAIPKILLKIGSELGDHFEMIPLNSRQYASLTKSLTFNDQKARRELNWTPNSVLKFIECKMQI